MENAVKALYIAGGVIVGVLILSLMVALFTIFGDSGKNIVDELNESNVLEFNNNFYKFYGEGIKINVYDLVTMTNFARMNNIKMQAENQTSWSANSDYIEIVLYYFNNGETNYTYDPNFEKHSNKEYTTFIKNNYFTYATQNSTQLKRNYRITRIQTNPTTGKVVLVILKEEKII